MKNDDNQRVLVTIDIHKKTHLKRFYFDVQQKKVTHAGLVNDDRIFSFGWTEYSGCNIILHHHVP